MATFTTKTLSGITQTTAIGGGYYSASTNNNFSAYGIAWNTSPTPTIANSHTVDGSGTGKTFNWTSSLTGLTPNTLYYVRAYVTSTGGTAYAGGIITGRTTSTVIHLATLALSSVTNTTATSGGKITGITGGTVTEVGVRIYEGVETGYTKITGTYGGLNVPFIIPITGLLPETYYSVEAYAITTGNVTNLALAETFTTAPNAPQVHKITQPVSPNETGSVSFINLPNHMNTLRWSGTATGSTTFASTGVTITGLTTGSYLFSIKTNVGAYYSPTTSVTIKATELVPTEFTATGYDLYYKTGIGDGAALNKYLIWLDIESVLHEQP